MTDSELSSNAMEYVRQHKKELFRSLIEGRDFGDTNIPVAIFMAGTPGAGKTEVSKSLLALFDPVPIRIDADEIRKQIPGYNGTNSGVVQPAASVAVDKILDQIYEKNYPFLLDATFAVGKAVVNLKRAIRHGYIAQVYYIYQDPIVAWNFTKIREAKEGRHVPKEAFINAYFQSRNNVKKVKDEFGDKVLISLIIKNYDRNESIVHDNISDIEKILPKAYNLDELKELLND